MERKDANDVIDTESGDVDGVVSSLCDIVFSVF